MTHYPVMWWSYDDHMIIIWYKYDANMISNMTELRVLSEVKVFQLYSLRRSGWKLKLLECLSSQAHMCGSGFTHSNRYLNRIQRPRFGTKRHPTRYGLTKANFFVWGQETLTPAYPNLGQGSRIQENWFQNRIQQPRFSRKGHPTRYGFAEGKFFCLGSGTFDPWISSFWVRGHR